MKRKIKETTSGSVAAVATGGPTIARGASIYGRTPKKSMFKGKVRETAVNEEELSEDDLIIVPGKKMIRKNGLIPRDQVRTDHEVSMARSDLVQSAKNAKAIFALIKDVSEDEGIPGWVQEKLIKASDYLNTVREYLEGQQVEAELAGSYGMKSCGCDSECDCGPDFSGMFESVMSKSGVAEGWKDKVAGAAIGAAALGGIGAAINMSPNVTIQGQQARLAVGNVPANAKLVTTDDGKKVHVWSVRGSNPKSAGSHQELVYKPAEVKEQGVAEGFDNPYKEIDSNAWHLIQGDKPIAINFPDENRAKSFHSGHGYGRETKVLHGSQVRQNAYLKHNPGVINWPEYSKGVAEADKHSFIGRIQRHNELKKKVDSTWQDAADAEKRGDKVAANRAFNKHVKYANLERPGTWTDVKEQGVAEGTEQVYKVLAVDKSNALSEKVMLTVKAASIEEVFERLAMNDWYPFEINGVEVINGKRLKKGVAEGFSDVVKGVKRALKGKEHPDVVAARHAGRAMGHYNLGDIQAGDKESQRYAKTRDMHLKAKGVAEGTDPINSKLYPVKPLYGGGGIKLQHNTDEYGKVKSFSAKYRDSQQNQVMIEFNNNKRIWQDNSGSQLLHPQMSNKQIIQDFKNAVVRNMMKHVEKNIPSNDERTLGLIKMKNINENSSSNVMSDIENELKPAFDHLDWIISNLTESTQRIKESTVDEKAVSKQQQKFFGMVHALQKGKPVKGASPKLKQAARDISKGDVKDFAKTRHSGLPSKVKKG